MRSTVVTIALLASALSLGCSETPTSPPEATPVFDHYRNPIRNAAYHADMEGDNDGLVCVAIPPGRPGFYDDGEDDACDGRDFLLTLPPAE